MNAPDDSQREVTITAQDLPLACPRPGAPLWARHPRVYLDVFAHADQTATCPYCGTRYRFSGKRPAGHH